MLAAQAASGDDASMWQLPQTSPDPTRRLPQILNRDPAAKPRWAPVASGLFYDRITSTAPFRSFSHLNFPPWKVVQNISCFPDPASPPRSACLSCMAQYELRERRHLVRFPTRGQTGTGTISFMAEVAAQTTDLSTTGDLAACAIRLSAASGFHSVRG